LVFFQVSLADLMTDTNVSIIPINNNTWINLPHPDTITLDVTHEATCIVSVIAKNDVVMINKNKKFISESLSLQPKYDNNKFLNLKLMFRPMSIIIDTSIISVDLK